MKKPGYSSAIDREHPQLAASGPIPKFVSIRRTFRDELRNLRTTSYFLAQN
jgi:hypothetical protein